MEENILKAVYEAVEKNESLALVTLTEAKGSTPREHGSIMAVFKDGRILGSIGGGPLEYSVTQEALEAIKMQESRSFSHELTPKGDLAAQCGGYAKGYIKVFNTKNRLIIVGGGHIGEKLLKLGKFLGFYCEVVDNREDFKKKQELQIADKLSIIEYEKAHEILELDNNCYIVVATQNYLGDLDFIKTILDKDYRYLGSIGSKKKQSYIQKALRDYGFNEVLIDKIYGPIGIDISNQLPEEIAFSVLSEILLVKNNGSLKHKKESKNKIK